MKQVLGASVDSDAPILSLLGVLSFCMIHPAEPLIIASQPFQVWDTLGWVTIPGTVVAVRCFYHDAVFVAAMLTRCWHSRMLCSPLSSSDSWWPVKKLKVRLCHVLLRLSCRLTVTLV